MKFVFEIGIRIPMRGLFKPVAELEGSINKTMEGFGFSEKMMITSVMPMTLTVTRMPTDQELSKLREITLAQFKEKFQHASIEYWKLKEGGESHETNEEK